MEELKLDNKSLRKFALTMGIAFLVITMLIFLRHRHSVVPTFLISVLFFICAFTYPAILRPLYVFWMKLAFVLSWVNTRLVLTVIFYLIFAPVGIFMRILARDPLEWRIDKNSASYWKKKEVGEFNPSNYTRQF